MKKTTLFLTAITAFTLASCTEDESVNLQLGKAIDFRPAIGTRGTEITNANLNEISVAAFQGNQTKPFFNPTLFTKGTDNYSHLHLSIIGQAMTARLIFMHIHRQLPEELLH